MRRTLVDSSSIVHSSDRNDVSELRAVERKTRRVRSRRENEVLVCELLTVRQLNARARKVQLRCLDAKYKLDLELVVELLAPQRELARIADERL